MKLQVLLENGGLKGRLAWAVVLLLVLWVALQVCAIVAAVLYVVRG